ncbi:hypothetical protein [Kitasatospora sp. KL5]|uniref:hypothetical protein n=1 Tax=Kitasatospora sp. KL5 TaxID=3425125 RepID=UPI003D6F1D21
MPEGQRETLTHKVAEKALFGPMKVQLPVRLSGAPAVYALVGADLLRPVSGAGGWTLRLTFSVSPTQSFSTTAVPVGSNWLPRTQAVPGTAGETDPAGCREQSGLVLCVQTSDPGALAAVGGASSWLSHFAVVGADPASWGKPPVWAP